MIVQIVIGAALIFVSIVVKSAFVAVFFDAITRWRGRRPPKLSLIAGGVVIGLASLWMTAALGVSVAIWAAAFQLVGAFDDFETAAYFAGVAFTTLGFGDLLTPPQWRHLAGLCAANGLLVFGLSTALLVETMRRLWTDAQGVQAPDDAGD